MQLFNISTFIILCLVYFVRKTSASLNLYLTSQEVQRLLGIPAELFYIRDGNVNAYALNFTVLISSNINDLIFTWENTASQKLQYSIEIKVSDTAAIPQPKLNISQSGNVPTVTETFAVSLACSKTIDAEVLIFIIVNITSPTNNVTTVTLQRRKTCLNENKHDAIFIAVDSPPHMANSSVFFYLGVFFAVLVIFIITLSVTIYYVRTKKNRASKNNSTTPATTTTTTTTTFLAALPRNSANINSYASFHRMPSYSLLDDRSKDIQDKIIELNISRSRIHLKNTILEGTFGRVFEGTCTNDDGIDEPVLIKSVADHASQVQISLLLQEGIAMYSLNHRNILSILRISIEENSAPYLLYPFNNFKNVKIFLQKCKVSSEGVHHTLTTQEVVHMALQVIKAMQYLHKRHLIHKDLAARNCVVDDKLNVKVTDNALSRDLFPSDYHCLGDNENRPIKWLALESLLNKTFSPASDVWSFGVLLWELTTLAQQPYLEIDPFEVSAYLKDGYRLIQPVNCPDELFAVMAYCWAMSADERPTFTQLHVCLQEFYTQLTKYV